MPRFPAVLLIAAACLPAPPANDPVWVPIPPGASIGAVADTLAAYGIVASARRFVTIARFGRQHADIKPGLYPFTAGTPAGAVLAALRRGTPPVRRVVVQERLTLAEVAAELEARLGLATADVDRAARDAERRARVGARAETVEGYLFPTTYYLPVNATAGEVLDRMADTFEAHWNDAWTARLDTLGLSRDEVVTLASIIAGEMPWGDERFVVASVYHNRLARGMRLQADPTVVYALGERRRLTFQDYTVPSAYNTYTVAGLPPGPIGQPSTTSIEAALYPTTSDYLFMVAGPDGRHVFSRTYGEHLATIRRMRN